MSQAERRESEPLLTIEDLAVSFPGGPGQRVRAVDGASMSVFPRQTLAVVGESGCGKSVTAMSVLSLVPNPPGRVDRGRIMFRRGGETIDLAAATPEQRRSVRGRDIAMIFQEPMTSLNPVFTIGEQIIEAIRAHRDVSAKDARQLAIESMLAVGLRDAAKRFDDYPHQFSGGMRQRVMIAMTLACEPSLLLADEPTTALDVTIQAQILDLIAELKSSRGLGVMLITHDLGVVAENADVVCVMYAGRVVEYAPAEVLFNNPTHPYTRGLLACVPRVHAKQDRLRTVEDVTADVAAFEMPKVSRRAWWPWHEVPSEISGQFVSGDATSTLVEIAEDHWVGVWRTPDDGTELVIPRLEARRSPATVLAT